jgi:hypothetical protein
MESSRHRRSRRKERRTARLSLAVCLAIAAAAFLVAPPAARSDLVFYDPDFDISMGLLTFQNIEGTDIQPVVYFGGYFSMKNPIFVNSFNVDNIYNIIEAGFGFTDISFDDGSGSTQKELLLTVPFFVDFAYRLRLSERFSLFPFVGSGFVLTDVMERSGVSESSDTKAEINPVIKTGIEFRYLTTRRNALKLKIDYGLLFIEDVPDGYIEFVKIRFPFPFIP